MRISVIQTLAGMEALGPEWLALWRECPKATPFQSPQWLVPWTKHLFGGGQIQVLAIRDGAMLVGLAPLFQWGNEGRTVSFMGAGISDYGDLLFAPGCEAACTAVVRQFLSGAEDDWDVLDLQELRAGSGLLEGWAAEECSVCPVLELSAWPGSMDGKQRTDWRRARNKLPKGGDLEFLTATAETAEYCMDEFIRLHEARWGVLSEPLRRFHCDVVRGFADSGDLRLSLLRIGGQAAAAVYAFKAGKTLCCYLSGFDPDMAKLSPGAVLLGRVIEQAVDEGMAEVDFLRDGEAYKYLWGARDRVNYRIYLKKV
jgi:CelD/BcsL family acetyltransferase involved in cellulose biosynthesis